jgi:hypothetical protein
MNVNRREALVMRTQGVIHIITTVYNPCVPALAGFVDFSENLTVYYMVGLPEKG